MSEKCKTCPDNPICNLRAENKRPKEQSLNWISVKERLPEVKKPVLVLKKTGYVTEGYRLIDGKFVGEHQIHIAVTHWAAFTLPEGLKLERAR